jgi:DNA-binding NtrC family response regulator
LLGAFENGSFVRVGGSEPVPIDARIIAATRHDLAERVREGEFREDLFFHLNVVPLQVPAMRDHAEDVPELLSHYVDHFVVHEGLDYRHFGMAAQNYLRQYAWPGNIRELKNLVQRLLIMGNDQEINLQEVEAALVASEPVDGGSATSTLPINFDQPLRQAREEFERLYLEYQLDKHQGNVTRAAQEAGMERTHLYRKIRAVGIEIKERR